VLKIFGVRKASESSFDFVVPSFAERTDSKTDGASKIGLKIASASIVINTLHSPITKGLRLVKYRLRWTFANALLTN